MKNHKRNVISYTMVAAIFTICITACPTSTSSDDDPPTGTATVLVQVDAIRSENLTTSGTWDFTATAIVREEDEFSPISEGASVKVAGQTLADATAYYSNQNLPAAIAGDSIAFSVAYDGSIYSDTLTMPDPVASITAPTDGASVSVSSDLTVTWDTSVGSNPPSYVRVLIYWGYTQSGSQFSSVVPFDNGSLTIPANTLSSAYSPIINVDALNKVDLSNSSLMDNSYFYISNRTRVSVTTTE